MKSYYSPYTVTYCGEPPAALSGATHNYCPDGNCSPPPYETKVQYAKPPIELLEQVYFKWDFRLSTPVVLE